MDLAGLFVAMHDCVWWRMAVIGVRNRHVTSLIASGLADRQNPGSIVRFAGATPNVV